MLEPWKFIQFYVRELELSSVFKLIIDIQHGHKIE